MLFMLVKNTKARASHISNLFLSRKSEEKTYEYSMMMFTFFSDQRSDKENIRLIMTVTQCTKILQNGDQKHS